MNDNQIKADLSNPEKRKARKLAEKHSPDLRNMIKVPINDRTALYFKEGTSWRVIQKKVKRFKEDNPL